MLKLSDIIVYPVKSCAGISLHASDVEERGLEHDRRRMLTDENGRFLTQRELPELARIRTAFEMHKLMLSAEGADSVKIPLITDPEKTFKTMPVTVWNDTVEARIEPEASEWFSDLFGKKIFLVSQTEKSLRFSEKGYSHRKTKVSFADGFPFLLTTESSLAELNRRSTEAVPMDRFRPNLVISGSEAFEEDNWTELVIGFLRFNVVKPCARCIITTTDQITGERGQEPLRTLRDFRMRDNKIIFGQNLLLMPAADRMKTLHIGDPVKVRKPICLRDEQDCED